MPTRLAQAAIVSALLMTGMSALARAEILPRSGVFEGVYHRDRFGVGRFGYYLVAPDLHGRLGKVENLRIQLQVERLDQPLNPGMGIIRAIGGITILEPSPLGFELKSQIRRRQEKLEIEATFFLVNRSESPIDISLQNVVLRVYSKSDQQDADLPNGFFPEYTRGQTAVKEKSIQWINNHLTVAVGSFESGHHVQLDPHQKLPLVARFPIAEGEHEFKIEGHPFRGETRFPTSESWFKVNVSDADAPPVAVAGKGLRLDKVAWTRTENVWKRPIVRLTFTVARPANVQRSVVICSKNERRTILAGTIAGFTKIDQSLPLSIDPCYDCSNLGEPWILAPIPPDGLTSHIDLKLDGRVLGWLPLKHIQLELLTDNGLESFVLDVPMIDLSSEKEARRE
jgi:hypothetical protein